MTGNLSRALLAILAWWLLALGSLTINLIPGEFGESLCGPWG
jgi:hypothetical protein